MKSKLTKWEQQKPLMARNDNAIGEIESLLKREIAVQILNNRLCVNNIAALFKLQQLDGKSSDSGQLKLEFDISARKRTQAELGGELVAYRKKRPLDAKEAPDGGTPSPPSGGGGGRTDGGTTDAGTYTTTKVVTTTQGNWSVKVDFGH